MAFTRLNNLLVHWRETGKPDAPAVIFVNSLGTDCRLWDELAETLGRDWRIMLYDKRGHGLTQATPGPYSIAMLADDLLALADYLGLARFAVVGLSIGGLIAQQVSLRAPQRLSAHRHAVGGIARPLETTDQLRSDAGVILDHEHGNLRRRHPYTVGRDARGE